MIHGQSKIPKGGKPKPRGANVPPPPKINIGEWVNLNQLESEILTNELHQELIIWRGECLTLYSPVIYDCAEVKWLPFRVM